MPDLFDDSELDLVAALPSRGQTHENLILANVVLIVAVPTPLRRTFDYSPVANQPLPPLGCRVRVPFGGPKKKQTGVISTATRMGIVVGYRASSEFSPLKSILAVIDTSPVLNDDTFFLCRWASNYYQFGLGATLQAALPKLLRDESPAQLPSVTHWRLSRMGKGLPTPPNLSRAKRQNEALLLLQQASLLDVGIPQKQLSKLGVTRQTLLALQNKQLIEEFEQTPSAQICSSYPAPYGLTTEQAQCLSAVCETSFEEGKTPLPKTFSVHLVEGATGSGKTEIYLQLMALALAEGKQVLVLIPEIGLSPQTLARFTKRFDAKIVVLHSGLNDTERKDGWLLARAGIADIVIGTRSAVFVPMPRLGLMIIDEEHDTSFKQQEGGLPYHARDLAVIRAHRLNIPLLLGTATPSLESLNNALTGKYQHHLLKARAGAAKPPTYELLDIRQQPLRDGLSPQALRSIEETLARGEQALIFINQRGFAPALICHDCGWLANCSHCDARMTLHRNPPYLHCHHCDHRALVPKVCPHCQSRQLIDEGCGSEKVESGVQDALKELGIDFPVIRIDRDTTRQKHALANHLAKVNQGDPCVLVGTQMLAKGHHFPKVTLVVIVDIDGGLFSADFRGPERMGQLLMQVAGRAGRESLPGKVLIQTHHSQHPWLQTLVAQGYSPFADSLLQDRQAAQMPPFAYLAVFRAESEQPQLALQVLESIKNRISDLQPSTPICQLLGPMPAAMERRQRRFRFVLQLRYVHRGLLQSTLQAVVPTLESESWPRSVRWQLDVDPQDWL